MGEQVILEDDDGVERYRGTLEGLEPDGWVRVDGEAGAMLFPPHWVRRAAKTAAA